MQITIKIDNYQDLEVYKSKATSCTYDAGKKELTFEANVVDGKVYRLVYNSNKFIDLIEGQGITITIWDIFTGTKEECLQKMKDQSWKDAKIQW
jgi:hypothetical protein